MSFHLLPYAVLKVTLLYLSANHLLQVKGSLASEIEFYQIMFHCIQGLLYMTILCLCPKCRCILVLVVFLLKTPLINLLINGCSDISGNPGSVTILFSAVRPMHTNV